MYYIFCARQEKITNIPSSSKKASIFFDKNNNFIPHFGALYHAPILNIEDNFCKLKIKNGQEPIAHSIDGREIDLIYPFLPLKPIETEGSFLIFNVPIQYLWNVSDYKMVWD
jgi:hypothetical protein